jgi:hypothetical protein
MLGPMAAAWAERFRRRAAALDDLGRQRQREPLSYAQSMRIFEAMWNEARALGVLERCDPLEGIDADIALVKAIRRVRAPA